MTDGSLEMTDDSQVVTDGSQVTTDYSQVVTARKRDGGGPSSPGARPWSRARPSRARPLPPCAREEVHRLWAAGPNRLYKGCVRYGTQRAPGKEWRLHDYGRDTRRAGPVHDSMDGGFLQSEVALWTVKRKMGSGEDGGEGATLNPAQPRTRLRRALTGHHGERRTVAHTRDGYKTYWTGAPL